MSRNDFRGVWVEDLESRRLLSSIDQVAGIGYLPSDNGTKFQRYDVANQQWLTPITLQNSSGGATASLVDGDGIYVAYDRSIMRYKLDGSSPTHLINTTGTVHRIHSDGNLLFLNHTGGLYARFISFDKATNTIIDTMENYVDSVHGSSISTTANKIFGRTSGVSPADITYVSYDDSGNFLGGGGSPYHGDYPSASETWVFPLGTKVVDDSGGVYSTSNLTRLNSFNTSIDDIAFVGSDVPIVLKNNSVTAYTSTILPAGAKGLSAPAKQILLNSTNVIAFNPDPANPNRYTTQIIPLADLEAPAPGEPVNPVGLTYKPDDIEIAANGTLLLLDKETQSVFRWDPETQNYGATIPLLNVPNHMAYSGETNTLYVAYASGLINSMDLNEATPTEKPFAVLPSTPIGLSTAGQYLFAADNSGAWESHFTFAPDGMQISAVDWNYYSTEYIWSPVNSKMYFFRDDTSPNDLLSEVIGADGKIGATMDSPLHTSAGFQHPIRVSPDGAIVILGSGMVHDATTLARQPGGLGNTVSDITWLQGSVYTVRNIAGYTQFQQWTGSTFAPGAVAQLQGTPVGLFTIAGSKLVGIYTPSNGVPEFRVMDGGFQVIPAPLDITGTTGNDTLLVRRDGTHLKVYANADGSGTPMASRAFDSISTVTIDCLDGDDTVVLNFASGGIVTSGGLTVNGGNGSDAVHLHGATGDASVGAASTSVAGSTLTHTGMEIQELPARILGTLAVGDNAAVRIAGTGNTMTVSALTVGSGGKLDLGTNDLKVLGGDFATIQSLLKTAHNGTAPWQGPGIGTSAATQYTGLSPVQQSDSVVAKFSYNGDATGDGLIDADDYFRIDAGFISQPANPLYAQGDFNYDGTINADDYFLIDSAFIGQGQPLATDAPITAAQTMVSAALAAPAEPEQRAVRKQPVRPLFSERPVSILDASRRAAVARRR